MDQPYKTRIKKEEEPEQRYMPIKQEKGIEGSNERTPTAAPNIKPSNQLCITTLSISFRNCTETIASNRSKKNQKAKKQSKEERRMMQLKFLERKNTQLRQELASIRDKPSRVHELENQVALLKEAIGPNKATTITSLRIEIFHLEKKLKDALREGENAKRDVRAYKNSIMYKEDKVEIEALEEELAQEKVDNSMEVSKLENRLEEEKARSEEAHRLLCESVKLVAHMTSLLKGQGRSVH